MKWVGEERRKFPRISVELFVRYKILDTPAQAFEAQTKNISGGGVCLITREELKPGTIVAMDIRFPRSQEPVVVSGRVIWSDQSKLGPSPAGHLRFDNGIEFVQISEKDRNFIMDQAGSRQNKGEGGDWKIGIVKDMPHHK